MPERPGVPVLMFNNDAEEPERLGLNLLTFMKGNGYAPVVIANGPGALAHYPAQGISALTIPDLIHHVAPPTRREIEEIGIERCRAWSRFDRETGVLPLYHTSLRVRLEAATDPFVFGAAWAYKVYRHCYDWVRPRMVMAWNGLTTWARVLLAFGQDRGLPAYYVERGLILDTLSFDPDGINYSTSYAGENWGLLDLPAPPPEAVEHLRALMKTLGEGKQSFFGPTETPTPDELRAKLKLAPDQRVVLFILQIESDSNVVFYSPIYKTMPEIIRALRDALRDRSEVSLLVKPHPVDHNRRAELEPLADDRCRFAWNENLYALFAISDVVVCINSTAGLEARMQNLPVVVLGGAAYSEKGFTYDLKKAAELRPLLWQALDHSPPGDAKLANFLFQYLTRFTFSMDPSDPWGSRRSWLARWREADSRDQGAAGEAPGFPEPLAKLQKLFAATDGDSSLPNLLIGVGPEQERNARSVAGLTPARLTKKNFWYAWFRIMFSRYRVALLPAWLPTWCSRLVRAEMIARY